MAGRARWRTRMPRGCCRGSLRVSGCRFDGAYGRLPTANSQQLTANARVKSRPERRVGQSEESDIGNRNMTQTRFNHSLAVSCQQLAVSAVAALLPAAAL